MFPAVKPENRLPASYKLRCLEHHVTQDHIAEQAYRFHPARRSVTFQFVNRVLNAKQACPSWLRRELDHLLRGAEA